MNERESIQQDLKSIGYDTDEHYGSPTLSQDSIFCDVRHSNPLSLFLSLPHPTRMWPFNKLLHLKRMRAELKIVHRQLNDEGKLKEKVTILRRRTPVDDNELNLFQSQ